MVEIPRYYTPKPLLLKLIGIKSVSLQRGLSIKSLLGYLVYCTRVCTCTHILALLLRSHCLQLPSLEEPWRLKFSPIQSWNAQWLGPICYPFSTSPGAPKCQAGLKIAKRSDDSISASRSCRHCAVAGLRKLMVLKATIGLPLKRYTWNQDR